MKVRDPALLGGLLTELHGLELGAEDIARTQELASLSLEALAPFIEASLFDTEPAQYALVLEELADGWEPEP